MNKRLIALGLSSVLALTLAVSACSPAAAPAPTAAPAKPAAQAAPTAAPAAPAAAQPTAAAAQPTAAPAAQATWPDKTKSISFIVPYAAGGVTDLGSRILAADMEKVLGLPVQIINKPGAGSQTGVTEILKAKPDGYTIGIATLPTMNLMYLDPERKAGFGVNDVATIAVHVQDPSAIGVKGDGPYKTFKEFVDAAKAKPETIKFASDGPMTDDALGIVILEKASGAKFVNVGFTSGNEAMTSMLGGHVDASFGHVGDFISQAKTVGVRVLGVASEKRNKFFPDVPTFKEQGFDLINSSTRTIIAPAATPKEIVETMSAAIKKAMDNPEAKAKLEGVGLTDFYLDSAQSRALFLENDKKAQELVALTRGESKAPTK